MVGLKRWLGSFLSMESKRRLRHYRYLVTNERELNYHERSEREDFLRRAVKMVSFNEISGDYAEFGCCGAMTFTLVHKHARRYRAPRHQWAFDSFAGLPPPSEGDTHPSWSGGDLAMSEASFRAECRRLGIGEEEMTVVPGYYEETIGKPDYPGRLPDDIAFAYIDCDLYSSTATVLAFLRPRLKHGMVIAFDDYYLYDPNNLSGERAAFLEFEASVERFVFTPYHPYAWGGMSYIVEDRELVERHRAAGRSG